MIMVNLNPQAAIPPAKSKETASVEEGGGNTSPAGHGEAVSAAGPLSELSAQVQEFLSNSQHQHQLRENNNSELDKCSQSALAGVLFGGGNGVATSPASSEPSANAYGATDGVEKEIPADVEDFKVRTTTFLSM